MVLHKTNPVGARPLWHSAYAQSFLLLVLIFMMIVIILLFPYTTGHCTGHHNVNVTFTCLCQCYLLNSAPSDDKPSMQSTTGWKDINTFRHHQVIPKEFGTYVQQPLDMIRVSHERQPNQPWLEMNIDQTKSILQWFYPRTTYAELWLIGEVLI